MLLDVLRQHLLWLICLHFLVVLLLLRVLFLLSPDLYLLLVQILFLVFVLLIFEHRFWPEEFLLLEVFHYFNYALLHMLVLECRLCYNQGDFQVFLQDYSSLIL